MSFSLDPFIQLKHTQESLEFALESGRMGTWDIDLMNNSITCSKEMLELWGISPVEFTHQRSMLQEKVHPDDLHTMNEEINFAIQKGSIYEHEYRIIPSPGELRWVISRGRCLVHPETGTVLRFSGVVYDVTEKKQKQEILDRAIKSRDHFFMVAGHELKTPLTCLDLQLQVMEWDLKNPESSELNSEKFASGIKKQREHVARITRIIDNILDESRIKSGSLPFHSEEFDFSEMVIKIINEFKIAAEASAVTVNFSIEEKICGKWDRFRLEQAVFNLLTNALRYGNKRPVNVRVWKESGFVHLAVRDEGIGIKSEDHERIFERFERGMSDNEVDGLGLGLFITRNIVRIHNGEIKLKSEHGKGSEFIITLPHN